MAAHEAHQHLNWIQSLEFREPSVTVLPADVSTTDMNEEERHV